MSFWAPFTFIMNTLVHLFDGGSDIMNTGSDQLLLDSFKEMIFKNPMTPSKQGFSAAALFGRPELTQGQRIKFGIKIEQWINIIVDNHPTIVSIKGKESNLWMDLDNNKIVVGGNGEGLKDIDNMFRIDNDAYYLEAKSSLDLDTEKGPATIEKVEAITESLRESGKYSSVTGKILSPFWEYEKNIPTKSAIRKYIKKGGVMFFKEFSELLDLGLTKEKYEARCKKMGKLI